MGQVNCIRDFDGSIDYVINSCSKCDISITCKFTPGRGRGATLSMLCLMPAITSTEYKNNVICGSRKNKIIRTLCDKYNFKVYYTSLIKCVSKRPPTDFEILNCKEYIKDELSIVKPKIIILVGSIVTKEFLEFKSFSKIVNKAVLFNLNGDEVILYPIYHPASECSDEEYYISTFEFIDKLYKTFISKTII